MVPYCVTKPPIIGPKVGPLSGPMDQIEKAKARYSSVTISLTVPGELAIIALPATAPKNRTTITSGKDVASPQGMIRTVKRNMLPIYTGRRPYISLTGARIILPTARPMTDNFSASASSLHDVRTYDTM